ncbi:MAG: hypothetical protein ACPLPS_09305, partial [bacterium]
YRLTGEVNPIGGNYSYTYDAVGNRTSMTHNGITTNCTYDAGNKLLQTGNTTFTYEGKRIGKTTGGTTTNYYFDGDGLIIEAQEANILAYYTQGQGLLSQRRNNDSCFHHSHPMGMR